MWAILRSETVYSNSLIWLQTSIVYLAEVWTHVNFLIF